MLVVNADTYYFNITEANNGNPKWELYHNIPEAYGIEDMSPSSLYSYAKRVLENEKTALEFFEFQAKGGPDGYAASCDE